MANQTIHDEFFADMLGMRRALGLRFRWYYHVSPIGNADSIRQNGLVANVDKEAPSEVKKHLGNTCSKIICLNPLGSDVVPPAVQQRPYLCVAICREALPLRVGLDWSYDGAFGIAEGMRLREPGRNAGDIFAESAQRWGSVVSYDPITAAALRACTKGCLPHDPKHWPMLSAVTNDMLVAF
jgi:hypothetical protein